MTKEYPTKMIKDYQNRHEVSIEALMGEDHHWLLCESPCNVDILSIDVL
jgi:hypothetical protein